MYSKFREGHFEGKFAAALSRPVLDLWHCASRGESSVEPERDFEKEAMGAVQEERTPTQEEALKKLTATLQEMTFKFPERKATKELYPHFHHKTDKMGRPVYIERLGQLQLEELLKVTTLDRMLLYHIKEWEILIDWKFPACSKKAGRTINQSLTILDLKGVTMKHMSKQVRHFIQRISKVDQDYYPEYLGKMVIVNTPTAFKAIWAIIKPWLDKRTQKKIEVHGSNYTHKLLELVEPDNLPEFLGGSCQCPGGCENSDAGPWNDAPFQPSYYYEIPKPKE